MRAYLHLNFYMMHKHNQETYITSKKAQALMYIPLRTLGPCPPRARRPP